MVEVTVMGAGIFGLSVAYACAKAGAKVRVIEKRYVGAGSSGGLVGALAPHTPERWDDVKEFQLQSLLMAEQFWAEVDAKSSHSSGYGRTGRLQPIANDRLVALARERTLAAKDLWQGQAEWRVVKQADFGPWAPDSPSGLLVHDTLSARMHPRQACHSLAAAVMALGGDISNDMGAAQGKVVWATGYEGILQLADETDSAAGNGVKGQSILLDLKAQNHPQMFADGVHVVPHADGTVAIGSTSERYFDNPQDTDDLLDAVYEKALKAFPVLRDAKVLQRWAGVRPRAKTRAPMLGEYPDKPGVFLANGGFKIGFAVAPLAGQCMAQLVLEGRNTIPTAFHPSASLS